MTDVALIIGVVMLFVLFGGEPDIVDGIVARLSSDCG